MLELKNISKSYKDKLILKDINIIFPSTGFIGIKGRSGCGKSTLLYILGMLDENYEGEILYNGESIEDRSVFIKEHISFVMQHNDYISSLNVKENIKLAQIVSSRGIHLDDEILKKLKIKHLLKRFPHTLSGGELKRMSIAKAIMKDSTIVLCDEPTGALSFDQSKSVMQLLKDLSKDRLVIIVSHNDDLLDEYCDDVLYIEDFNLKGICHIDEKESHFDIKKKKSYLYFYPIREFIKNKYKYIFFFIFQWIICTCFILMLGAMNGFNELLEYTYKYNPLANIIYVENNNQKEFTQLNSFKNYKYSDYFYDFTPLNILNNNNYNYYHLPHNTNNIKLINGKLPKEGEVLVTLSLKEKIKDDYINLKDGDNENGFFISGVIEDSFIVSDDIYFSLDEKKNQRHMIDKCKVLIEVEQEYVKETIASLSKDFITYSDNLLLKESYTSLIYSAKSVACIFMGMNILISAILIKIVFSIVYHNKKRHIAYFYSLGMSKKELIQLFLSEVVLVSFILVAGSIVISSYMMNLINETYILKNMFHIVLKLNKFFICSYDVYICIALLYLIVSLLTGIKPIKEAVNDDYIEVLRGE